MDCLEFRRRLGSEPQVRDGAALEHQRGCAACTEAVARAQVFDADLARAMALPVPEGLAERILLAQLTGARQGERMRRRRYGWLALAAAASLVLAFGVTRNQRVSPPSLQDLVVAHVNGPEREALQQTVPMPASSVARAFANRGVTLQSVPDGIAYVHECPVGSYRSVHMVMPEHGAPVSVLYIVDHRAGAPGDFRRAELHGREVPLADGTLVLLAQADNRFDAIERSWRNAIEGPPQVAAGSR